MFLPNPPPLADGRSLSFPVLRFPHVPIKFARLLCLGALLAGYPSLLRAGEETRSLAGAWQFQLDRGDIGIQERWFGRTLSSRVQLPGSLPDQQIGDQVSTNTSWTGGIVDRSFFTAPEYAKYREPGQVKVPFWLQPETYYSGPAWYQREVEVPKSWEDQRVTLFLERPHWETRVWVDGRLIGRNLSLSTPHEYDLGVLESGKHSLTIRVDNHLVIDIGRDSHSVSDHTQGNWNGIVGKIELRATPLVWLDDLQIYPSATRRSLTIRGRIGNATALGDQGTVSLRVTKAAGQSAQAGNALPAIIIPISWPARGGSFECELAVPGAQLWDEFQPVLYELEAVLKGPRNAEHRRAATFAFRDFATQGTEFTINGRKTFLRGTLECCIFPKTGHPPTDIESWRRIIRTAKAYGLNNLRFHSWCPPEAAFRAADELGMYLHVECSSWANASTTLGDGKPVDGWIYDEADRILHYYGNHPSFVIMLYGNEPGGDHHKEFLGRWVAHYKEKDPRRLYTSGAGWPQLPENQFHITPDPRIQAWGQGLKSRINAHPPETRTDYRDYISARQVPVISHEIGQWCVYPNFDEMKKYTGYLKPRNFEIFRDTLTAHHLERMAKPFLLASGKLQTACYKEEIESALRTPGMGGFQLLDLHDFPGQGTALVGVLDPFWEDKGYVTAAQYARFCGPTVPLARFEKRVFTQDEQTVVRLEVAHFGNRRLDDVWPVFKLVGDDGQTYQRGHLDRRDVELGNGQTLGDFTPDLRQLPAPARYRLVLGLAQTPEGDGQICENDWDLWVYPAQVASDPIGGVTIVRDWNNEATEALSAGGKVLWLLPPNRVAPDRKLGKVELGFSSIFWNTAWTKRQAPHTLGILCDPKHPSFADFPTDFHSNWQWWYLVHHAGAMILDGLPADLTPTIEVIDDWVTARKLALAFEAKVGPGRLLVCSVELNDPAPSDPVTRQFRHSLLEYMASDRFQPRVEVTVDELKSLAESPSDKREVN
jgi:hypothetical protein